MSGSVNVFSPTIATDLQAQKRVRKWIRALRSGKYAQGTSYLRRADKFCCLGVACDLVMPDAWRASFDKSSEVSYHPFGNRNERMFGATQLESAKARRLYRLTLKGANLILTGLNDGGKSFSYIAGRLSHDLKARIANGGPVIDSRP